MAGVDRPVSRFSAVSRDRLLTAWLRQIWADSRWLATPIAAFLISRIGIVLVAYLAIALANGSSGVGAYHLRGTDNLLVDAFGSRWDTGFYVSIVEEGYVYEAEPFPSVPFFPMLPLLMRVVLPLFGDAVIAGLVVTNIALLGAAILFYRLVDDEWGDQVSSRAVWYLLIFPTAFFGTAIYSESVFLFLSIGALLAGRRERWWLALLLGIGATATRLVGIVILPLLLLEWYGQWRRSGGGWSRLWQLVFPLATPSGLLGYMLFLGTQFGDPLGFVTGSAAWGRVAQSPLMTIQALLVPPAGGWHSAFLSGQLPLNDWLDLLFVLLFSAIGITLLAQRRWGEGLFVWSGVMLAFSSGLLMSQRRYVWVLFPAFVLLARWGDNLWVDRIITFCSLIGLGLFTALFVNGHWVG